MTSPSLESSTKAINPDKKKLGKPMNRSSGSLSILYLLLSRTETSAPYNEHCLALANRHEITICTYFGSDITPPSDIKLFEGDDTLTGFFRVLRDALADNEYDVIHAHSPHVGIFYIVANILYGPLGTPTLFTMHDSYQNEKLRNKLLLIPIFALFHRIICCGNASLESFPTFFRWLAGRRLYAIQNGVDLDRVDRVIENNQKYLNNGFNTIVMVGRLAKVKNPIPVLRAFHQAADQNSRLVIIGKICLSPELIQEWKVLGIERQVELAGLIPREKVYEYFSHASLFISASRGEGLPVAVLEAMACRCPVLLSDIPPHREIVGDIDFIPLIQPDDVAGYAREIKRFIQLSASERACIGDNCRKLVEERFSLITMHKRYEEIYNQLMGCDDALS